MVSPEAVAALTRVTPRTVYQSIEAGQTHFTETPAGEIRVCLNSFEKRVPIPGRIHESEQ